MFGCQRTTRDTRVSGESTLRGDKLPFIQMYAFQFYIETTIILLIQFLEWFLFDILTRTESPEIKLFLHIR